MKAVRPKGLGERALGGFGWNAVAVAGTLVLQLAVLAVLARLLDPYDFGVVGAALVVVGFSEIFSKLGLGPAIVQVPTLTKQFEHTAFGLALLLGITTGIVVFVSAPWIAAFFRMEELTNIVRVLAIGFPISALGILPEALLLREMAFRSKALITLLSVGLGYGALGIGLGIAGAGVWALVAAHLGKMTLRMILSWFVRRPTVGIRSTVSELKRILRFGSGMALAQVGNYSAGKGDDLVVGRWLGAAALGYYGRAYEFMMAPVNFIGQAASNTLFPMLASIQDDAPRLRRVFRRSLSVIAIVTLPLSVLIALLAPEFVNILLGPNWSETVLPLQILAIALLFRTSYKISDSLAQAKGAVFRRAWRQWVYAGAVLLGAGIGQSWGVAGVAAGVGIAVALNFGLMLTLSLQLIDGCWRDILIAHRPGLWLGACALLVGGGVSYGVGFTTLPNVLVVAAVSIGVMGGTVWGCRRLGSESFADLAWIIGLVGSKAGISEERVRTALRFLNRNAGVS